MKAATDPRSAYDALGRLKCSIPYRDGNGKKNQPYRNYLKRLAARTEWDNPPASPWGMSLIETEWQRL